MLSCDHTDAFNVTHGTVPPALLVCLPCRGWEPGDAEVEEATLVVQLLAELAPARHLLSAAPQLQEVFLIGGVVEGMHILCPPTSSSQLSAQHPLYPPPLRLRCAAGCCRCAAP